MKKITHTALLLLTLFISVNVSKCFGKTKTIDLTTFLTGTKHAYIELTHEEQHLADNKQHPIIIAFAEYLKKLNFQKVAYTTEDKRQLMLQVPTLCDVAKVRLDMVYKDGIYKDNRIRFRSCKGDESFVFSRDKIAADVNLYPNLKQLWIGMYGQPIAYNSSNRLELEKTGSILTEEEIRSKLANSSETPDFIEGIYEKEPDFNYTPQRHKVAILKEGVNQYNIYYLEGISNFLDWEAGELMGSIPVSDTEFKYKNIKWTAPNRLVNSNGKIDFADDNTFDLQFTGHPHAYRYKRITPLYKQKLVVDAGMPDKPNYEEFAIEKMQSPITAEENNMNGSYYLSSTGSAIAITQDGYIITNHHVVAEHDYIELMIPNSRFGVAYRAVVVASDKATDLALLKIEDIHFHGLPTIPYHFRYREADVGEDVFTLGFPMVESMGWDIKLGDGLISSSKGYRDDPKTYQISVPVNPGNSGGPLFSKKGELVGIIKAKHSKADNASYALKNNNILNLINKEGLNIKLPDNNYLKNKSITEQVKQLEAFVFWVKAFKVR